tara:strand:- start:309 stop:1004 length:696 start_codon:yes stop_codon:yes gene_type:complete
MEANILESLNNASSTSLSVSFLDAITILFASTLAGFIIRFIFFKYGESMSSKRGFGNTILLVTISVASLITVVKSSLALSLGLVGALSVVRFRTAIKEPYNLAFLLLSICIGISLGASQFKFALIVTIIGSFVPIILKKYRDKLEVNSSALDIDTITIQLNKGSNLNDIYEILEKYTNYFSIKSIAEDSQGNLDLIIRLNVISRKSLENIRIQIRDKFAKSVFAFYETPNK